MAKADVFNLQNEKVGELELSDEVFGAEVKEHLLHEVVVAQLASRRQGTRATKERSAVRGSSRKIYKQKGTGSARHGSIRAPLFVGGGHALARVPQDYSYRPPRKVRVSALKSALSLFFKEGRIIVLENIELAEAKTKKLASVLDAFNAAAKTLVVDGAANENLKLSLRNMAGNQFLPPEGVNVYDLLRHDHLIVSREAAKKLEERCLGGEP